MQVGEAAPLLRSARIWSWVVGGGVYLVLTALTWYSTGALTPFGGVAGMGLTLWVVWMVRMAIINTRWFLFTLPPLAAITMVWREPSQRWLGLFLLTAYFAWLQVATEGHPRES
jgi:hypothetical protein